MSAWLELPLSPLIILLAKVSLVLGCGLLVASVRRTGPALRHAILLASVSGALALPWMSVAAPHWDAAILPSIQQGAPRAGAGLAGGTQAALDRRDPAQHSAAEAGMAFAAPASHSPMTSAVTGGSERPARNHSLAKFLLIALWPIGTLVLLTRLLVGRLRLRAIAGRAWALDDASWGRLLEDEMRLAGVSGPVRLLVSPAAITPLTWGTRAPVVLLPDDALVWTADRGRVVLRHELAHIARGDAWALSIAAVASAVYWFHPLALMATKRLRAECERACDDRVVALGTEPQEYATHLLDVARAARDLRSSGLLSLAMARPSHLEARLRALLDTARPRAMPTRRAQIVAISLPLALAIVGSALHPVPRAATGAGDRPAALERFTMRTAADPVPITLQTTASPGSGHDGTQQARAEVGALPKPVVGQVAPPGIGLVAVSHAPRGESVDESLHSRRGATSLPTLHDSGKGVRSDDFTQNVDILLRADLTLPSSAPVQLAMSAGENLVLVNDRDAHPLDLRVAIELLKQIRAKYGRDIPGGSVQVQVARGGGRTMRSSDAEPYALLLRRLQMAPMEVIDGRPVARHFRFGEHPVVEVAVSDTTLARLLKQSP